VVFGGAVMGTFFKALEQAERDRALKEQAKRRSTAPDTASVAPSTPREEPAAQPTVEAFAPPSVFQRPTERQAAPKQRRAREIPGQSLAQLDDHLTSLLAPASFGAEQYRALRLRVEQLRKTTNLSIVGVTSPQAGDGKTLTAINLAGALAQAPDSRVLLVDADLRRSSMTACLGLDASRGRGLVGAILDPGLPLKEVTEPCPPFNLSIVRAGTRPSAPYELLKSPRFGQLLEEARQQFDYVVVDMPPLVPLPDCGVIGRSVDGFLIVVAANKTPRKLVEEALKVLDPATVVGLIFNGDNRTLTGYYGSPAPAAQRTGWWGGSRHGQTTGHEEAH
jgi:capsular exopolysaccharide synthesis family protein